MMHRGMLGEQLSEEQAAQSTEVGRRLLAYLAPYRKQLIAVLALVLVGAASQAGGPYLMGRAIDTAIAHGNGPLLDRIAVTLIAVYVVGALASRTQIVLIGGIGQRVLARLRSEIFVTVQQLSLSFFDRQPAGDLMSRLTNDTDVLNQLFSQGITQGLGNLFGIIGIVVAMFLMEWRLALASFAIIPAMLLTTRLFARLARRAFRKTRESIGDVSTEIQEEIAGVRVAQAFNRTRVNQERFARRNAANRDANVSATAVTSAFAPAMDVLSNVATAIVAGYGGFLALHHVTSVGVVVAFLAYVRQFFFPIQQLSTLYTTVQSALAGAERIFNLLDTEPELTDVPDARPLPPVEGRVEFDQVWFSYGGRPSADAPRKVSDDDLVLRDVDLVAEPGQVVAIVGPTGAGKTTLVNLIGRFYDVTDGAVRIDGIDVREVTRPSLRQQMGVVLQDSFLFAGTIADNIRYGRLDATDAEVEAAAKAARADEFIQRLAQGYNTRLGERGGTLSQGQRQLIGIARALLANPRILILDEATSSVDTRTEALIQGALKTLLKGRTSIVIAHRLSTIREADQVLVLDHGQIVERGTHDELLAHNGRYAELYRRQFRDVPPGPAIPLEEAVR